MAKVISKTLVIKVSKLVKDSDDKVHKLIEQYQQDDVVSVIQEMLGDKVIVECEEDKE